ncbi:hypothetical protein SNEBB_006186 [Seison nebaliae]|nr:hypothetical protein SNEBB_006186 [Seison nebaliae]
MNWYRMDNVNKMSNFSFLNDSNEKEMKLYFYDGKVLYRYVAVREQVMNNLKVEFPFLEKTTTIQLIEDDSSSQLTTIKMYFKISSQTLHWNMAVRQVSIEEYHKVILSPLLKFINYLQDDRRHLLGWIVKKDKELNDLYSQGFTTTSKNLKNDILPLEKYSMCVENSNTERDLADILNESFSLNISSKNETRKNEKKRFATEMTTTTTTKTTTTTDAKISNSSKEDKEELEVIPLVRTRNHHIKKKKKRLV